MKNILITEPEMICLKETGSVCLYPNKPRVAVSRQYIAIAKNELKGILVKCTQDCPHTIKTI